MNTFALNPHAAYDEWPALNSGHAPNALPQRNATPGGFGGNGGYTSATLVAIGKTITNQQGSKTAADKADHPNDTVKPDAKNFDKVVDKTAQAMSEKMARSDQDEHDAGIFVLRIGIRNIANENEYGKLDPKRKHLFTNLEKKLMEGCENNDANEGHTDEATANNQATNEERRFDQGSGPFTWTEFEQYYDDADVAQNAWDNGIPAKSDAEKAKESWKILEDTTNALNSGDGMQDIVRIIATLFRKRKKKMGLEIQQELVTKAVADLKSANESVRREAAKHLTIIAKLIQQSLTDTVQSMVNRIMPEALQEAGHTATDKSPWSTLATVYKMQYPRPLSQLEEAIKCATKPIPRNDAKPLTAIDETASRVRDVQKAADKFEGTPSQKRNAIAQARATTHTAIRNVVTEINRMPGYGPLAAEIDRTERATQNVMALSEIRDIAQGHQERVEKAREMNKKEALTLMAFHHKHQNGRPGQATGSGGNGGRRGYAIGPGGNGGEPAGKLRNPRIMELLTNDTPHGTRPTKPDQDAWQEVHRSTSGTCLGPGYKRPGRSVRVSAVTDIHEKLKAQGVPDATALDFAGRHVWGNRWNEEIYRRSMTRQRDPDDPDNRGNRKRRKTMAKKIESLENTVTLLVKKIDEK
jgi:hypothetical protein